MSTEAWVAVVLAVVGLVREWLNASGRARQARMLEAVVKGVEAGAVEIVTGRADGKTDPEELAKATKKAVEAASKSLGVDEDLAKLVEKLTK